MRLLHLCRAYMGLLRGGGTRRGLLLHARTFWGLTDRWMMAGLWLCCKGDTAGLLPHFFPLCRSFADPPLASIVEVDSDVLGLDWLALWESGGNNKQIWKHRWEGSSMMLFLNFFSASREVRASTQEATTFLTLYTERILPIGVPCLP